MLSYSTDSELLMLTPLVSIACSVSAMSTGWEHVPVGQEHSAGNSVTDALIYLQLTNRYFNKIFNIY